MIVADAGPIVAFARIARLDLLRQVLGEILIPQAVHDGLVVKGIGRCGAQGVESADWIRRREIGNRRRLAELPSELGDGEGEAILSLRSSFPPDIGCMKSGWFDRFCARWVKSLRNLELIPRKWLDCEVEIDSPAYGSVRFWADRTNAVVPGCGGEARFISR